MSDTLIRAAGGVVLRPHDAGYDVLLVGDGSREGDYRGFPKGKLDPGETFEMGALREVREETGIRIELLALAGISQYQYVMGDGSLRDKIGYYYLARPIGGRLADQDGERAKVGWVRVEAAVQELTYENDRAHLQAALDLMQKVDLYRELIATGFTDDD